MKKCTKCGRTKSTSQFNHKRGGFNSLCRMCDNASSRERYPRYRETHIKATRERNHEIRATNKAKIAEYLLTHPCVDCSEKDRRVLDFDHTRGKKKATVTRLSSYSKWEIVLQEIKKCEVRCANCHRIKTLERAGWSKES